MKYLNSQTSVATAFWAASSRLLAVSHLNEGWDLEYFSRISLPLSELVPLSLTTRVFLRPTYSAAWIIPKKN
jgi:hypothetical protein